MLRAAAVSALHCRKDIAHIWELAGGEALTAQLTQGSHIFITHRQASTQHVWIMLAQVCTLSWHGRLDASTTQHEGNQPVTACGGCMCACFPGLQWGCQAKQHGMCRVMPTHGKHVC